EIAGLTIVQPARISEIIGERVKRAGDSDEEAGQREGDPDVSFHRDAEKASAALVLANGQHRAAERRAQYQRHRSCNQRQEEQDEVVERIGVGKDIDGEESEMEGLARKSAQAVVAARERAPLERDVIKHLPEGDGYHGEVDPTATHYEGAQKPADNTGEP